MEALGMLLVVVGVVFIIATYTETTGQLAKVVFGG